MVVDSQRMEAEVGVLKVYQGSSPWNPNSSARKGDWSNLIPVWTPSALTLQGEKTVKPWISIWNGWNLRQGVFWSFLICSHEFPIVPEGTATDLLPFLSGLPVLLCWGENRLSSCGFWFTLDGAWWKGYSSDLKSVPIELQTVPDGTVTDLLRLLSGLPVSLHLGEQTVDVDYQWMEPEAGDIPIFSDQFSWLLNSLIWNCNRCPLVPLWTLSALQWGRTDCHAVDLDS